MVKRYSIALFISLTAFAVNAQDQRTIYGERLVQSGAEGSRTIDSLTQIINNPGSHDTSVCNAYLSWGEEIYLIDPDTALILWQKAHDIAQGELSAGPSFGSAQDEPSTLKKRYLLYLADALNNIGYIYHSQGDIPKGLEYFHKSLKIQEEIGGKKGIASSLNNIGAIYDDQGDIPKALEYFHKSLKIQEEIGDKRGIAVSLNNIGLIYYNQGDPSVTASKEASLRAGIPKALEYYHKSLKIKEKIGDKKGIATSLNNIGLIYNSQGDISKGLEYFHKSLKIYEEIGNKEGIATSLNNIGSIELERGALTSALNYGLRGLDIAREIGSPRWISFNSRLLSKVAKKQGNYQHALEMYELHILMRDSINNEETQKASIRQQMKYEFEKAQLIKEQEEKEVRRKTKEVRQRRDNLQYSVILIAILVLFGGVLSLGFVKVSERAAEGIIFFSFLILFEFLLVLADPYIEEWSGGAPGFKLLFNAGVAALIFPLHSLFETKLKSRLVK